MVARAVFSCAVFVGSLFSSAIAGAASTAEELLEEINRLPAAERQARLEKGARKEGSVVWYVSMNRSNAQDLANAFEADYPFLKVNVLSGGGPKLVNRIVAEHRGKAYLYDVLLTRSLMLNYLRRGAIIMRYQTPYRKFLPDGFFDRDGYFNGVFSTAQVFLFNTRLVNRAEAPKSIEDLLHTRWKGKLTMDQEAFDWLAAILDHYGEEKGKEIAKRLGEQNLQTRRGHNLIAELVAAGELPMTIDAYTHEAARLKKAGAPVEYVFPEPFVPVKTPTAVYASSNPPHPHTMALFIDFLLSKKGQEIMERHGRWVAHKEISSAEVGDKKILIPSPEKWGDREKELARLFGQLLRRERP
jgi:iron(III) transport system substrate-binding protein